MQPELRFKAFEASTELPEQRALFLDCFPENLGQTAAGEPHYAWKFQSYPAKRASYEYEARLADDLIGYYAAIPYPYRLQGREAVAGMVCDVMTGSKARGKGVFTKLGSYALGEMKQASLDFTTGYPIRPEVIPGHLKVGWKVVQKMPIYIKVVRTRGVLQLGKAGFLAPLGDLVARGLNRLPDLVRSRSEYDVQAMTVAEFLADDAYPVFLESWLATVPNGLVKSREFLRWRLGAPATEYRVFVAKDRAAQMVAVCISRNTVLREISTLALLDLMILPGHRRAFHQVDRSVQQHAVQSGAELIATMIHPDWARRYGLWMRGYLPSPFVFSLIVRKLNDALPDQSLFEPSRWHTMWVDSDDL